MKCLYFEIKNKYSVVFIFHLRTQFENETADFYVLKNISPFKGIPPNKRSPEYSAGSLINQIAY